jgi:hypothetical protein
LFAGSQDIGFGDYVPETLSADLFAASSSSFQGNVAGIVAAEVWSGFDRSSTLALAKFAVVEGVAVIIHSTLPGTRAFDANAAEWISLTVSGATPVPRYHCAVATLGVRVYVFGGLVYTQTYTPSDQVGAWNFEGRTGSDEMRKLTLNVASKSGVWTSIPKASPWPAARYGHGFSAFGADTLLLFGGLAGSELKNDLWMFTVSSESWQELSPAAPAPSPRRFFGFAVVDGAAFVVGGDVSASATETSQCCVATSAVDDVWAWDGLR